MYPRKILSAAIAAIVLPFAASAATLTVIETTTSPGTTIVDGVDFFGPEGGANNPFDLEVLSAEALARSYEAEILFRTTNIDENGFLNQTGPLSFNLINNSGSLAAYTVAAGTVRQQTAAPSYGFTGGVGTWFDSGLGGIVAYILDPVTDEILLSETFGFGEFRLTGFQFDGNIAADSSVKLVFDFDNVKCGENCPNIDFTISTTPVPVPAAGFLLLGGLGGLALMRRRKKS